MTTDKEIQEMNDKNTWLNVTSRSNVYAIQLSNGGMIYDATNPLHVKQVQQAFSREFNDLMEQVMKCYPYLDNLECCKGGVFYSWWQNVQDIFADVNLLAQWLGCCEPGGDPIEAQRQRLKEQRAAAAGHDVEWETPGEREGPVELSQCAEKEPHSQHYWGFGKKWCLGVPMIKNEDLPQ